MPKDGSLAINHGTDSDTVLRFSRTDGSKRETGFLKIYVSNVYIDMSSIAQASPFEGSPATDRAVQKEKVTKTAGWSSTVYALTVTE